MEHEGFEPSHPCYYKFGGKILSVVEIESSKVTFEDYKFHRKHYKTDIAMLNDFQEQLDLDIKRYQELVVHGPAAMGNYDIMISGSAESAWYTALGLKHNHIFYNKGYVKYMQEIRTPVLQGSLF